MMRNQGLRTGILGRDVTLRHSENVVPKRGPLVLLVPDVRALEGRDLVVFLAFEEDTRASSVCLHVSNFLPTTRSARLG
jgi:hypothetical protein